MQKAILRVGIYQTDVYVCNINTNKPPPSSTMRRPILTTTLSRFAAAFRSLQLSAAVERINTENAPQCQQNAYVHTFAFRIYLQSSVKRRQCTNTHTQSDIHREIQSNSSLQQEERFNEYVSRNICCHHSCTIRHMHSN